MSESDKETLAGESDVAIIGMAGRFPGARNLSEFWHNLRNGVESITFFSDDELLACGVEPATLNDPSYIKARGVLDEIDQFDSAFFGFNPREAEMIDPQQRVFLESAWEALEDAGYSTPQAGQVAVFAGVGMSFYLFNLLSSAAFFQTNGGLRDTVIDTTQIVIGNDKDFLATRVSYKLNLKGPSVVVQSACSTSLLAVHLACQSILNGECDLALAGGVRLSVPPRAGYYAFDGGIMSPDGHCRAYDARAQGTVAGSGVGIVVLKRLADALADGDNIRAVIKGSASNNDGSYKIGYTAPSTVAQASVITEALAVAGISPDTVSYVEGHGTATPLGDPIEVEALTKAFRSSTERRQFCALGSVKTNIGHLDAAAGVAGLIKTVLMLEHKEVVASLHYEEANEKLEIGESPFYVAAESGKWEVREGERRRAGVSSFGLGGTNVHLVLEEPAPLKDERPARAWQTLLLSAKTPAALEAVTANLAAHFEQHPETNVADAAFTLAVGRHEFGFRRAVICDGTSGAVEALRTLDSNYVATGYVGEERRSIAFMFPGGGAQYVNMCAEIYRREPLFRSQLDLCARLFEPHVGMDIRSALYPCAELVEEMSAQLLRTSVGLPILFATEYALARLWMSWGVQPSALIGHSLGEYAAACLAGVFSLEDVVALVALRGRLFEQLPEGAMLSVPLTEAQLRKRLGADLSIAAINGPALCVASGARQAIDALAAELTAEEIDCQRIQIDVAAHSSLVSPILDEFTGYVETLRLQPPQIPFVSNVTGTWITQDEATDARYWARQLRETVRFGDGVAELLKDEGRVLLEVGPGHVLSTLAKQQVFEERKSGVVSSVRHPYEAQSDLAYLAGALGRLWIAGGGFDKAAFFAGQRQRRIPLSTYPFERQRHWVAARHITQTDSLRRRADIADWFYLPSWRHTLAPQSSMKGLLRERKPRWLIFTDGGALAGAFIEKLAQEGCELLTVTAGDSFARTDKGAYVLAPDSPGDYVRLFEELGDVPTTIVHLWSLTKQERAETFKDYFADCQRRGYYSLLYLAQALALQAQRDEVELVVVTNYLHDVSGAEEAHPEKATILAPCKVLPQEDPLISCLCVDVGPQDGRQVGRMADLLLAEIAGPGTDPMVAYRGGRRLAQAFDAVRLDAAGQPARQLRERGVYLITGGFGTVGSLLAQNLASTLQARLALVGRTPLPEREGWAGWLAERGEDNDVSRRIRAVEELEGLGGEVLIISGDVADETFLSGAVERVEKQFGQLHGVLHAAGTVRGASILNPFTAIGQEESKEQFRSKVLGVYALEKVLGARQLDFCLLFSSNASVLGGLGLLAYAAANQFLDAFANDRSKTARTAWLCASWDGWSSNAAPSGRERQTSIAEYAMSPEESVDAFRRVLTQVTGGHVVVSAGDLQARKNLWLQRHPAPPEEVAEASLSLHERPQLRTAYEAPRTEAERLTVETWQALLGIERIGVKDNFFELGGHSLLATQVVSRIRTTFKIDIPLRSIFESPTVEGLAARIEEDVREQAGAHLLPIAPVARDGELPLSFAQQRLWFIEQFEPGLSTYNIPGGLRLMGQLNVEALASALNEVVRRHEILRTRFAEVDGRAVQFIEPEVKLDLPVLDVRHLPPDERECALRQLATDLARAPFDLSRLPLVRTRLVRTNEEEHVLLFTMHHIVSDGWSIGVLVRDVAALYKAYSKGEQPSLPELSIQYADFASWQRGWLQGEVYETQLAYWQRQLAGEIPVLDLPVDNPRPALQTFRGSREQFKFSRSLTDKLKALGQRENVTLFMLLLAAFDVLLHRYTGQHDIIVGTAIANRTRRELEGLLGFFINTLALRVDVTADPTFAELLRRVREVALGAYAHQDLPFEHLIEALQLERTLSHSPLFQVMFVLQNAPVETMELEGLTLDWFEVESETAKFDLSLSLMENANGIAASLEFNSDLFERHTIRRLLSHLERLLTGIVENPQERISQLPLLSAGERTQLVSEWNQTAVSYDAHPPCLHQLFEQQVLLSPRAPALISDGTQLSYQELNNRANQLAHRLQRSGVGPESLVGVCLSRSTELVISLLAILKAGAAYLPLDPEYPGERLRWMMADAGLRLVMTGQQWLGVLGETDAEVICVGPESESINDCSEQNPVTEAQAENLAYVLYTSGSTGRPKGVMISHEAIVNRLMWMQGRYQMTAADNVLQKTPFSFDVSVWEFFWPLMTGARLVLARPGGQRDSEYLIELIQRESISVLHFVPSMLEALLQEDGLEACSSLREVMCSGEALSHELQERFHARQQARLHNLYGPTEAAVDVTAWECERDSERRSVPIGRPIDNLEIFLLDVNLHPVPAGVAGELHIGGVGLARGYLRRPELTAEKFIPHPFSNAPGRRIYKTGDLARFMPDGVIEYLGRIDNQVKIRGNRIELGEIENALLRHVDVREAVVLARREESGQQRLVAYVIPHQAPDKAALAMNALRGFLQERLPDYMIPTAFVLLDQMPLTPNGKVDRRSLPAPDSDRPEAEHAYTEPRSQAEQVLCGIWSDVLRINRVSIHDNFFALGGDSIISIQIISRARQAGLRITPKQLFGHPTVAGLAAVAGTMAGPRAEQGIARGEVPLTPIQHWFFEQQQPVPAHFNQSLLLEVPASLEAGLMQRAMTEVVAHHDALRLRFALETEGWRQVYGPAGLDAFFARVDLSDVPAGEQREAIEQTANSLQACLKLDEGPLLRVALISLGAGQPGRLLIVIHHLAIDGVSWRILLEDVQTVYRQLKEGLAARLPAKTTSYQQWAQKLAQQVTAGTFDREAGFWLAQAGAASVDLKLEAALENNTVSLARSVVVQLDLDETRALLQDVPEAFHTQINDALLAALVLAFERWNGSPQVLVDLEGHGREDLFDDIDVGRTVGWFTSIYPVALVVEPESEAGQALKSVKEQLRRIPNRGIGYGLLRYLSPREEVREALASHTRAQISFNYLGQFNPVAGAAALFGPALESGGRSRSADNLRTHVLDISGSILDGRLQVVCAYSEKLHDRAAIEWLANEYVEALRRIIAASQATGAWGYTPSDFPLSGLNQKELDQVVGSDRTIEDIYTLSPMQHGLLFHALLAPDSDSYFEQIVCQLEGKLDLLAFERAWQGAVDNHAILRSSFVWEGIREPVQVMRRDVNLTIESWDKRELDSAAQTEWLDQLLLVERERGFQLRRAPLMRILLVRTGDETYHIVLGYHHILMDGWSMPLLLKDVFALYESQHLGTPLKPQGVRPYRDYIAWLKAQDLSRAETYWRETLAGFKTPTPLPVHAAPPAKSRGKQAHESRALTLSIEATAALNGLARQQGLTLSTLIHGAWAVLLSRYSGERDVLFGTTVAGRPATLNGVETMIGLFINTLPVRVRLEPAQDLLTWLKTLQTRQLELREYEYGSLAQVQRWSEVSSEQALFESILVFENYPVQESLAERADESLRIKGVRAFERTHYPLALIAAPGHTLSLLLSYDSERFAAGMVERMLQNLRTLLEGMTQDAGQRLSHLPLVSAEEQRLLSLWHAAASAASSASSASSAIAAASSALCLHQLFEQQVLLSPHAPALISDGSQLSYQELNQRANQLAHRLRRSGIGPESLVALCLSRSSELVVSLLAILKAGAAYLPLDPAYPAARLSWMLADANVALLITQESWLNLVAQTAVPLICLDRDCLDRDDALLHSESVLNLSTPVAPANVAYVLYTSGSTGRPKGVAIEHRSAANFIRWAITAFTPAQLAGVLFATSVCFDLSIFELFAPLSCGGTVILAEHALALPELAVAEQVSLLNTVPSVMGQLLEMGGLPAAVRVVNLAGEVLTGALAQRVYGQAQVLEVRNLYGPTEATTYATMEIVERGSVSEPTIGRGVSGTVVYLLDEWLAQVPVGVRGEVYLGGEGVARGYVGRAELTAERFVPDPYSEAGGGRLYRTGDEGRYRDDGRIEYLGRADEQVKVRGYRVEPGEIEGVVREIEGVKECVVVVRGEGGGKRLVMYVERGGGKSAASGVGVSGAVGGAAEAGVEGGATAGGGARGAGSRRLSVEEEREIRRRVRGRLPEWMVPEVMVEVEEWPQTANGKIDRRALPAPEIMWRETDEGFKAPSTDAERIVAAAWQEVLKLDAVGVEDNFFEVGGNSLHLIQVNDKLRKALQRDIPLREMFNHPTISALLKYLQGEMSDVASLRDESQAERLTGGKSRLQQRLQKAAEIDARRIS
jgi:amino acid adenylation domain-containing protein/non-ribosomal peptide synthase protein (TIGR01720 family)